MLCEYIVSGYMIHVTFLLSNKIILQYLKCALNMQVKQVWLNAMCKLNPLLFNFFLFQSIQSYYKSGKRLSSLFCNRWGRAGVPPPFPPPPPCGYATVDSINLGHKLIGFWEISVGATHLCPFASFSVNASLCWFENTECNEFEKCGKEFESTLCLV